MGNTLRSISVKLPVALDQRLTELARKRHTDRSTIILEAILQAVSEEPSTVSAAAAAGNLVGALSGPKDLSTATRHLADYGE